MLNRQRPSDGEGLRWRKQFSTGTIRSEELPGGAGLGPVNPGRGTGRRRTKAGMSVKGKDISIYHSPIKDLGIQGGERFRAGKAGGTNPRGLR